MHENPLIDFSSDWIEHVKGLLVSSGLGILWEDQPEEFDIFEVKNQVRTRLQEKFIQQWRHDLDQSLQCIHYNEFKTEFKLEPYLVKLKYGDRVSMARFRCRSNYIPIATFETIVRTYFDPHFEPICPICGEDSPDEEHYLLKCWYFETHRMRFLYPMLHDPGDFNINYLMNLSEPGQLRRLASFVCIVLDVFEFRHTRIPNLGS